ncbi:MAG TPA: hypothetical protein VFX02_04845 [Gammaproteobacteria bacterium]|nr:hypothetical protein [Gammaproteobacteria bacterium]
MRHGLHLSIIRPVLPVLFILFAGCAGDVSKPGSSAPRISRLVDLGRINVEGDIQVSSSDSDGRFMPGEWIAIQGRNLSGAEIRIDQVSVPVTRTYSEGLLMRVPQKLGMRKEHTLSAVTPSGRSEAVFKTSHYIIGTDPDGNAHHFMRANMDAEGLIENERFEIEQTRPFFNLVADAGALLYGIGLYEDAKPGYKIEIKLIDLVAGHKPREIASEFIVMRSKPTAAALSGNGLMLILGNSDITLVDVKDAYRPKQLGRFTLAARANGKTAYVDAEFLNGGKNIAVLETYGNRVTLLDISDPSDIRPGGHVDLFPGAKFPATADMFVDPADPLKIWVIGGRNLRNFFVTASEYSKSVFGAKAADDPSYDRYSMLVPLAVNKNSLVAGEAFKLPGGFVPFFGLYGEDGNIYISKVNVRFLRFGDGSGESGTKSWLEKIKSVSLGGKSIGGVLKVNIGNRSVENEIEGLGVYFHIARAPDLGAVFTLFRIKAAPFSSFLVSPAWGIGVQSRGTYAIRDADFKTLYPPYSLGYISIQE